jgi:xanthine dehydrogenase iron-sulfur cluster and FAD-binding subunit A
MLHWFAARQVKNRATIGGNIGTASPIGDLPPVLLSLDAEIKLSNAGETRTIRLADFFKGYRETVLRQGEVIVSVKIPKIIHENAVKRLSQSYKVGKRGTDDISIVAAAFAIDLNRENRIVKARLAYGGVAAIPARAVEAENFLIGKEWNFGTISEIKKILRNTFTPLNDHRGSAEYRKMLVANLFEKFFVETSEDTR